MIHRGGSLPASTAAALVLALFLHAPAQAGGKIVKFDVPGSTEQGGEGTAPFQANASGTISGWYTKGDKVHGFIRSPSGDYTAYMVPKSSLTHGFWINDNGLTAGNYYSNADRIYHGFVRKADGTITRFTPKGSGGRFGTIPVGLNEKGTVGGYYSDTDYVFRGFVRTADGKLTEFDAPGAGGSGGQGTYAQSLDRGNTDTIAGYLVDKDSVDHAFIRDAKGNFTVFDVNGAAGTAAQGINANGDTCGFYLDANGAYHGFVRSADGTTTTFDVSGGGTGSGQGTWPGAINDKGLVSGVTLDSHFAYRGFLRSASGKVMAVDVKKAGTGNGQGTIPQLLNDKGELVGIWIDDIGAYHGFYRMP